MQRAAFHLRERSGFKTAFLLVLLGLLCASTSLRAEGPILTLAMVNYDSLVSRRVVRDALVAKVDHSLSLTPEELDPRSILSFFAEKISLPTTEFLERRPPPEASNPLLLTLKNYGEDGRSHVWASLTFGYGQIFLYKTVTIYGRNGSCFEEPGCGFLKVNFDF